VLWYRMDTLSVFRHHLHLW